MIGFDEFRDQSQPLFTNGLVNSEMNFWTSQQSSGYYSEKLSEIDCKAWLTLVVRIGRFSSSCVCEWILNELNYETNIRLLLQTYSVTSARKNHPRFLRQVWTRLKDLMFLYLRLTSWTDANLHNVFFVYKGRTVVETLVKCKGPVTRNNYFSCNLRLNSTPRRCKQVTNVWYGKNILANCDGYLYFPILHLPREELRCKLQEKLHCVTGP